MGGWQTVPDETSTYVVTRLEGFEVPQPRHRANESSLPILACFPRSIFTLPPPQSHRDCYSAPAIHRYLMSASTPHP
jgi:hypothetical protein